MADDMQGKIAERLYSCLKMKNLSYGELSEKTGISKAMLQRYATGETGKIPVKRLAVLADALGVTQAYLIGWSDELPDNYNDPALTETEKILIELFRKADPAFQDEAIEMLKRHPK